MTKMLLLAFWVCTKGDNSNSVETVCFRVCTKGDNPDMLETEN